MLSCLVSARNFKRNIFFLWDLKAWIKNNYSAKCSIWKKHISIQSNEKTFKCSPCLTILLSIKVLMWHFQVHTGVKPFKDGPFFATFSQAKHLKNYLSPHACDISLKCILLLPLFYWSEFYWNNLKITLVRSKALLQSKQETLTFKSS